MAIYRKDHLRPYIQELELYYQETRRAVEGSPPNPDVAVQYYANPEQFQREYTDIDLDRVLRCVERFKATVTMLKQLKGKAVIPVAVTR